MSGKKSGNCLGRPRSHQSQEAILNATWNLLQTKSVGELSIEAIAKEACVGKATIYRWWSSKTAVVVDAFMAKVQPQLSFAETQSAAEALKAQFASIVKIFNGDYGRILREIVGEGQGDREVLESFRDRFLTPRREAAKVVIKRGIETGEFDKELDPELAMDILYGPIYYRMLLGHLPLDEDFAATLPKRVLRCFVAEANNDKSNF
ncbi:MAG: TetR/AcrR family transcriptional regulator [Heteroscytonema crispum UTEX LB 1556]